MHAYHSFASCNIARHRKQLLDRGSKYNGISSVTKASYLARKLRDTAHTKHSKPKEPAAAGYILTPGIFVATAVRLNPGVQRLKTAVLLKTLMCKFTRIIKSL